MAGFLRTFSRLWQAVLTESLAVLAVLSIEELDAERGSMLCGVVTGSVDLKNWSNLLDIQTQSKTNTTIMFLSEKKRTQKQ